MPDITLRRYTPEDIPLLYEAGCESAGPGFTEWMPWCHPNYALEESSQFVLSRMAAWEAGQDYGMGVFDAESGGYLGGAGINQIRLDHGFGNLGYWIRRSAWGKGYAVAAALAAAGYAFEELGLVRVEIVVAVGNTKSIRVAEKAGAQFEGIMRNRLRIGGEICDAHMYSLVPPL
ncbi:GNAT family N-acetyltransferase [bacterium]|nr:GNAT family N-acetyltransferase [bacterium]